MKVYLSCDMEGLAGITHGDETRRAHQDYPYFAELMTREAIAACEGALEAGATEIWIKDAHGSGRNLIPDRLPKQVRLIRGWSGHPYAMMQEIDESFDAAMMVGYHSMAGTGGNPLAHTNSSAQLRCIYLNGQPASEYVINSLTAFSVKVPVVFISGDEEVCQHAAEFNPRITTAPVLSGVGNSTVSLHPEVAAERIRQGALDSLKGDPAACLLPLPERIELKLSFNKHIAAYRASFYPGMRQLNPHEVALETGDYFEALSALRFVV